MKNTTKLVPLAMAALLGATACGSDFLTQGEASRDPNRPTIATSSELFTGVQGGISAELGSDPSRVTALWAQQLQGTNVQYQNVDNYGLSEATTNGLNIQCYSGGGLVDVRRLETQAAAAKDSLFLGIAQVQEALLVGTCADLFGDLVYSQALKGKDNPTVDDQLAVYDSVQAVLSAAIVNMKATGPTNGGPGTADEVYGGSAAAWTKLAHTLKARYYFHTAEVNPNAYALALAETPLGISSNSGNYVGVYSGATGEQNYWYQFDVVQRSGYIAPDTGFVSLLQSRNDPRLDEYFAFDTHTHTYDDLSAARLSPSFSQPFVTYDENTLLWAEAAYRTGDQATALAKLNVERVNNGLPAETVAGSTLLREILTEKYISGFGEGEEPFNDYKRTCFPNLTPRAGAQSTVIPGRLYYDAAERQTNTNIPQPGQGFNGARNPNDPQRDRSLRQCVQGAALE